MISVNHPYIKRIRLITGRVEMKRNRFYEMAGLSWFVIGVPVIACLFALPIWALELRVSSGAGLIFDAAVLGVWTYNLLWLGKKDSEVNPTLPVKQPIVQATYPG